MLLEEPQGVHRHAEMIPRRDGPGVTIQVDVDDPRELPSLDAEVLVALLVVEDVPVVADLTAGGEAPLLAGLFVRAAEDELLTMRSAPPLVRQQVPRLGLGRRRDRHDGLG